MHAPQRSPACAERCDRGGSRRISIIMLVFALSMAGWIHSTAAGAAPEPDPLVAGCVVDAETGKPLVNANVAVQGGVAGTVSVTGGYFTLAGVPAGKFTLVVTYVGYKPTLVPVDPTAGTQGSELIVALAPIVYAGDEIVVTASRYGSDVHLSQSNIPRDEIRRRQAEMDLPLLLEDTPGLYASTDAGNGTGYTYLKIRGFDQRRVGVLINGIPLNDPEDHQVYWVDLPDFASSLEDVQVQRGVTNSVGGLGAIGGTVNLVTAVLPVTRGGRLTALAGSYGTAKRTLAYDTGLLGGRFASTLRISQLASDGYRDRSGTDQWAVFWSGSYLTPNSTTQVNVYTGREITQQAWYGIDEATLAVNRTANPETYHNAVDDFRQPHYELHHSWRLSPQVTLRNSIYVIHGEGYYENFIAGTAWQYSLDRRLGFEPDADVGVVQQLWVRKDQVGWLPQLQIDHERGSLVLGGDAYVFHSNHWGEVMQIEGLGPADHGEGLKFQDFTGDKDAWSLFASGRLEIGGGLTLLGDLQYQRRDYRMLQDEIGNFRGVDRHAFSVDYEFFNPRGGVFWRVPGRIGGGALGLYGHVGTTQLEPSLYDLYDTWSGPEVLGVAPLFRRSRPVLADDGVSVRYLEWSDPLVKPEKALNYELGVSYRAGPVSAILNGYWMDIDDEIVPFGGIYLGYGVKGNAEKTMHRGVELDLSAQLAERHLLGLTASRSWDEFEAFLWTEDPEHPRDYAGNPIALFPRYLATLTWRADWGFWDSSFRLRVVGKQNLDNSGDDARTIAAYRVLDLGLGLNLGKAGWRNLTGARLQLRLRNVLDEKYETSGYYDAWFATNVRIPAAERNALVGVEYEF
jgi:iron complex outermembrane receptor protein